MLTEEVKAIMRRDGFYVNCVKVGPPDVTTYHNHEHIELVYIAQGKGLHRIGDECFPVEKGDLTLVNYGISHQVTAAEEQLVVCNFLFVPEYLDAAMKGTHDFFDLNQHFLLGNFYRHGFRHYIRVQADGEENIRIRAVYERLLKEYETRQIGYREIMRGYLIELLITIFRLNMLEKVGPACDIKATLDYIGEHFTQHIPLAQLAAMAGCSVSAFCRKFKDLTGITVIQYIQKLRVEYACALLARTDKNVTEIAETVGYSDCKYFYEVFRRVTGKLPGAFRAR